MPSCWNTGVLNNLRSVSNWPQSYGIEYNFLDQFCLFLHALMLYYHTIGSIDTTNVQNFYDVQKGASVQWI